MTNKKIAVVTGANRGLGLETSRRLIEMGFSVITCSRTQEKAKSAAQDTGGVPLKLDVDLETDIKNAADFIEKKFGRLDVLINNAGILLDRERPGEGRLADPLNTPTEILTKTLKTNTIGPFVMCREMIPIMLKRGYGRVVNVTSILGQLSSMDSGWVSYRISKAALNAVTRIFAGRLKGTDILVNSVHPGWVRTEMGGPAAELDVKEGVNSIIWAATLPKGGPTGSFISNRRIIAW